MVGNWRGVVAEREVKEGEVVMIEKYPFVAVDTHPELQTENLKHETLNLKTKAFNLKP